MILNDKAKKWVKVDKRVLMFFTWISGWLGFELRKEKTIEITAFPGV